MQPDRVLGCRSVASAGIMQAGCLRRSVQFVGSHAVYRAARVVYLLGGFDRSTRRAARAEQHRRDRSETRWVDDDGYAPRARETGGRGIGAGPGRQPVGVSHPELAAVTESVEPAMGDDDR